MSNARTIVFQLKIPTYKGVQFDAQIFAGSDELMFYKGDANSLMSTTDPSVYRTEASKCMACQQGMTIGQYRANTPKTPGRELPKTDPTNAGLFDLVPVFKV